jgi:uncharacterized protein YecE (DUF72 family)
LQVAALLAFCGRRPRLYPPKPRRRRARQTLALPWAYKFDPLTAAFTYVRLLGDRKGIEQITKTWDKTVVDRSAQLKTWVDYLQPITRRGVTIFAYANNHYSGHSPDTVKLFRDFWDKKASTP